MALDSTLLLAVERAERFAVDIADRLGVPEDASTAAPPAPGRRLPPGPPPRRRRVLGSLTYYAKFFLDPIAFVAERFATYGDIYYAPSVDGGLYAIRHPDQLQELLITRAAHFDKKHTALERMSQVLGAGLLTSDGPSWRRHRRMIQPAFNHARLAEYAAAMTDEAVRAAARLAAGGERDVSEEMMELTLRAVSRTLFSHDVTSEVDAFGDAMTVLQTSLATPGLAPEWVPTPQRTRLRRATADLDRITYGLIAARRRDLGAGHQDLLQTLVTAVDDEGDGAHLTEVEVRDELITLFLAGHETTAIALTWTLYLLSQHPDIEAKLYAEIQAVLGDRAPTYDDLPQMPYGEQVIHESMRLYPPAFMVARRANQDTELGGYPIPSGSEVVAWIYMTHHDARWYPEPERFRPERFAHEEAAKLPKLAYAPFGAGPRACIGKTFAMIEARLLLAVLVQRLRFQLVPGQRIELSPRITLRPKHGVRMRIRAR